MKCPNLGVGCIGERFTDDQNFIVQCGRFVMLV
jgi:hypothetical protein